MKDVILLVAIVCLVSILSIIIGIFKGFIQNKSKSSNFDIKKYKNSKFDEWANNFLNLIKGLFYKVERLPNTAPKYQGELELKDFNEYDKFLTSNIMNDLKDYEGGRFDE